MDIAENDTQGQNDPLDPSRANALLTALEAGHSLATGNPLPPFFHHLYFWDVQPPTRLGRDGHPRTGALIPDMGLPRRMWAGGRLTFHTPLQAGIQAEKRTRLIRAEHKTGRTGPLGFVTLEHRLIQNGTLCITECQDLVYREDAAAGGPKPVPPNAPDASEVMATRAFDTTLLFRYSALTFNGHRIHYDLDYARDIEGYAGLVVHGPLLAQLLMLLADERLGGLRSFRFRATAPLMHFEKAEFCRAQDGTLFVRGPDNRLCMTAEAI
ncbi:FAS1-like dehydratase domain-containing protein [Shimia biformata]|uniref:FAS1-like dehydratase domain-containing protein n=1 Tax=Shimia biformata TaxID=1294299 RepID=UPI00194E328D|nr:MaoC family dehydratase N-terminal domain-containing protein [Shimia biformata]